MNLQDRFLFNKYFFIGCAIFITVNIYFSNNFYADTLDTLGYQFVSIKKGDRCIVCDIPIKAGRGLDLLIKGRRVTIDLDHVQEFLTNKVKYYSKFEPKGALFQESAILPHALKSGWFILGFWIFSTFIIAAVCCSIAMKKGFPATSWFFWGFLLHVFGLIWILSEKSQMLDSSVRTFGKISLTSHPIQCPSCRAFNHPAAEKCSQCQSALAPRTESEVKRVKN